MDQVAGESELSGMRVLSALKGYGIDASDGRIGTVTDVLFDDATWKIRWLVVEAGTWLTGRRVLLHPSSMTGADDVARLLETNLTTAQVKGSPAMAHDQPVSRQMEYNLYDYYGWDPLWGGAGGFGAGGIGWSAALPGSYASATMRGLPPEEGDPHLRSIAAVTGYHLHATDGDIGHVEDFLVDRGGWDIRYLIVDTKNWWPGAHVLISPHAVKEIVWSDSHVELAVTREQVRASPVWDPLLLIDQAYQHRLHAHYNWPGYGW